MAQKKFKYFTNFEDTNEKRISFILITKNRGPALRKTLPTFRQLVTKNDELIIIDGASSDNTSEVVHAHQDLVTTFISEKDSSPAHAINKGLLLARGKYIVFLFDEDRTYAEPLEKAIGVLEAHPEIDILVCGGMKHFRGISRPYYYKPGTNYGKSAEDAFRYGTCANGFIIRRRVFGRVGLFPTDCIGGDDIIFMAQAIYRGAVVKFCRIKLFDFYMTEQSTSARLRPQINAQLTRFMKHYCSPEFFKKNQLLRKGPKRFLKLAWYTGVASYWPKVLLRDGVSAFWKRGILRQSKPKAQREYIWDGGFS